MLRVRIKQQQFLSAGDGVQQPPIPAGGNENIVEPVFAAGGNEIVVEPVIAEPEIAAGDNEIVVEPMIPAGPEIVGGVQDEWPLDAEMLMARITSFIQASTQLLEGLKSDQLRFQNGLQEPPENNGVPVGGNNDKKKRKKKKLLQQGLDHGYFNFTNRAIRVPFVIVGVIAVGVAMWFGFR